MCPWRPTGEGKEGATEAVGVVGVVGLFPYSEGNPSRLLLVWWSRFGDLRSNIAFSWEENIFCITFGNIAECNGDTSPGSLLNGNEKSLTPVGD